MKETQLSYIPPSLTKRQRRVLRHLPVATRIAFERTTVATKSALLPDIYQEQYNALSLADRTLTPEEKGMLADLAFLMLESALWSFMPDYDLPVPKLNDVEVSHE